MTCFEPDVQDSILSNPVVEVALRTTFTTAEGHPFAGMTDRLKELAFHVFKTLETAGETVDPDEIRRWARQVGGFAQKDAETLAEIAEAVGHGWTMRCNQHRESPFDQDDLEEWRQQARDEGDRR